MLIDTLIFPYMTFKTSFYTSCDFKNLISHCHHPVVTISRPNTAALLASLEVLTFWIEHKPITNPGTLTHCRN